MIFKFRREEIQPTLDYPSGFIYRPKVPLWIGAEVSGPRRPYLGLLDTGADDTKMSLSVARRLGIKVDKSVPVVFRGLGGDAIGYFGSVVFELRQSPKSWVWTARVAFIRDSESDSEEEQARVTLGHTGFFRYFHVGFDFQRGRAQIRPNRLFVGLPR